MRLSLVVLLAAWAPAPAWAPSSSCVSAHSIVADMVAEGQSFERGKVHSSEKSSDQKVVRRPAQWSMVGGR